LKQLRLTEEQLAAIKARSTVRTHTLKDERPTKASKYNNHRFTDSEGSWDSKRERARWDQLRALESAGQIEDLKKKIPYELIPSSMKNGKKLRPVVYIADYVYTENGLTVVEDCKGFRTKLYLIKKRLMWERYGIDIYET
jgi:hypothetical protein